MVTIKAGRAVRGPGRPAGRAMLAVPLAAALFLAAGCGGSGDEPTGQGAAATVSLGPMAVAKGEPVRIGLISDGKSAVSDMSIDGRVADATVKFLNEHRSGIAGRPIELVRCETQSDPAKAADCANRMIEEKVVAVVAGAVSDAESLWEPLHAAHLPVMFDATTGAGLLTDSASTFNLADPVFPMLTLPLQLAIDKDIKKVASVVIDVPAAVNVEKALGPSMFKKEGIGYQLIAIPPGTADMTPQLQRLASDGVGLVHVVGSDAFCISAFNGLRAIGYTGQISAFQGCISDATRKAVPGNTLKDMTISATSPIGTDNPSTRLYQTVTSTYGADIDISDQSGMGMFNVVTAFQAAVSDITGEITPATVTATIKSMPERELPNLTGLRFRCDGKANTLMPAVCVRGGLVTALDDKGQPTAYKVLGSSPS